MRPLLSPALAALSVLLACENAGPDPSGADATARADATALDAAATDAATPDAGLPLDARGFPIRRPEIRSVPCVDRDGSQCPNATAQVRDNDLVCTLRHGAYDRHFVYVQIRASMLDGRASLAPIPSYEIDGAFLSDGAQVVSSGFASTYDYGGGHHNDALTIELPGTTYRYYHSSFGFGFRRCQEPDCLQVFTPGNATPSTDGCTRDRTLPVVCVAVADDGTVPALDDRFMRCPGDT